MATGAEVIRGERSAAAKGGSRRGPPEYRGAKCRCRAFKKAVAQMAKAVAENSRTGDSKPLNLLMGDAIKPD